MEPPPRVRAYDPTTDTSVYEDISDGTSSLSLCLYMCACRPWSLTLAVLLSPAAESKFSQQQTQVEYVDVYLLSPEEDRAIELKDFTIMKPKNNKMHRLVRYYPRCEIAYTAAPPPPPAEEKLVTSPHGTTTVLMTTAHRHNGGFSNPSRNAEVFRLKRKLLNEYLQSVDADGDYAGSTHDGLHSRYENEGAGYINSFMQRSYKRPGSPSSVSSSSHVPPPPLPKYKRIEVGDEDSIPLTSERATRMSLKARTQYIDSLWPGIAPIDDDGDVMDYYGIEVVIISEEERESELKAAAVMVGEVQQSATLSSEKKTKPAGSEAKSPEKTNGGSMTVVTSPEKSEEDPDEFPEMTVETRSAALQKTKDAEKKMSPVASKQDDWVQCDKCQKWRRLPSAFSIGSSLSSAYMGGIMLTRSFIVMWCTDHVEVSELPATWYCKMNRWDKRFNVRSHALSLKTQV